MGTWIELQASDGHRLEAYRATPASAPRGRLLVLQEIFGVNSHMRSIADGFAEAGYDSLVPALFDRAERGVDLGYDAHDVERGRALRAAIPLEKVLLDMGAATGELARKGKVGAIGYCWGGSLAFAAAQALPVTAAIGYYGGQIVPLLGQTPRAPVMLHFGEKDHGIPLEDVAKIRAAFPDIPVHMYPAGHGFNCDQRADHDPASAALARERSLAFLARHVG